ncbi:MAG TPA: hypothetical protein PK171_04450, partial [Atribacter sp.]|nr:hypothetical protein [Atribacter sp.]
MNISHFLQKITQQIRSSNRCSLSTIQPVRPFIARLLSRTNYSPIFYITASEEIKRKVFRQIESLSFLNQDGMMAIGVDFEEKYSGIVLQKTLREKKNLVIVLNVNELDQEVVELENFMSLSVLLEKGKEYQRDQLIDQFYRMGYERKDFVREKGDIAIRGEVVDVYPPDGIEPIRTYWLGNLLEKMKYFQADTQRTDHDLEHALVIPSDGEFKTVPLIKLIMEQAHLIFWDDVFFENINLSHIPQVIAGIVSKYDLPEIVISAARPPSYFGEISKLISGLKENNRGETYLIFPSEKVELLAAILDEEKIPYSREVNSSNQIFLLKGFPVEGF